MTRRAGLAAALAVLLMFLGAGPASAAIGGCEVEPPLHDPTQGLAAELDPGPRTPVSGDPWAAGSDVTVYEVYGYGGSEWVSYDPGCVPDLGGSANGWLANTGMTILTVLLSFAALVLRVAFNPETLGLLDPLLTLSAAAFGESIFLPALVLVGGISGLWFILKSDANAIGDQVVSALSVGFIACTAVISLAFPLVLAPLLDRAVTGLVGSVHQQAASVGNDLAAMTAQARADPGRVPTLPDDGAWQRVNVADAVIGNAHGSLIYQTWCSGMVGRSGGALADGYCPRLFDASHLTRAEAALPAQEKQAVAEEKNDRFRDIAGQLQEEDPAAYRFLAGNENAERSMYMLLAGVAFACIFGFLILAVLLMLYALIVVRLAIMVAPLVAIPALIPPLQGMYWKLWDYLAGALLAGVLMGAASAAFVAGIGGFLSPASGTPLLVTALVMLMFTFAAVALTKPRKRAKALVGNRLARKARDRQDRPDRRDTQTGPGEATPRPFQADQRPGRGSAHEWGDPRRGTVPQEAMTRTVTRGAVGGAVKGAVLTAGAGLVTGGAVTVAALGAGAARGAAAGGAMAGVTRATGSPVAGAVAGVGAGRLAGNAVTKHQGTVAARKGTVAPVRPPAEPAPAAVAPIQAPAVAAAAPVKALPAGADPADPASVSEPRVRVFRPSERDTAAPEPRVAPRTRTGSYDVYTPGGTR